MKTFYYFLSEQPNYPNEICANSKQEVVKLLSEDLADPASILSVLSKEEFDTKMGKPAPKSQIPISQTDSQEIEEPPVDFNSILNSAAAAAEKAQKNNQQQMQRQSQQIQQPQIQKQQVVETKVEPKYFEEAGIKFKLVGNKLFKKVWTNLDENSDFRLINIKTNKIADLSKYRLEKLEWVEI